MVKRREVNRFGYMLGIDSADVFYDRIRYILHLGWTIPELIKDLQIRFCCRCFIHTIYYIVCVVSTFAAKINGRETIRSSSVL